MTEEINLKILIDGTPLGGGDDIGAPVTKSDTAPSMQWYFIDAEIADGWRSLQSFSHDGYLTLSDQGVVTSAPADAQRINSRDGLHAFGFKLAPRGDGYILETFGGKVIASSGALYKATDRDELATVFQVMDAQLDKKAFDGQQCTKAPAATRWADSAHRMIVERAFAIIDRHRQQIGGSDIVRGLYQNARDEILGGLHDADYKDAYSGNFYEKHFYNPRTGKNYRGHTEPTAFNQVIEFGRKAASHLSGVTAQGGQTATADYKAAGYDLGLALHFLTDLSQPMHAGNFTEFDDYVHIIWPRAPERFGWSLLDKRHSGYEAIGENSISTHLLDPAAVAPRDITDIAAKGVAALVNELARRSLDIYESKLSPLLAAHANYAPPLPVYKNDFTEEECEATLSQAFRNGQIYAAAFLSAWGQSV